MSFANLVEFCLERSFLQNKRSNTEAWRTKNHMCVKSSGRAGRHHGGRVASELFLFFSSIAGTSLVTVSVPPNRCVVQVSCFFLLTFCLQGKAPGAFRLVPGAYSFAWKATIQKSWLRRWFTLCRHVEADKSRSLSPAKAFMQR